MPDLERFDDGFEADFDDDGGESGADVFGGLFGNALAQAQAMQAQEVAGSAGGGAVRVVVNGSMEFRSVEISSEIIDSSDKELLEDLVLAALNDATAKIRANQLQIQEQMLSGLGGGGLGGLGKLFGGG